MAHDWESEGIRVALAIMGVLLLRIVRTWDRTQERIAEILTRLGVIEDRLRIHGDGKEE